MHTQTHTCSHFQSDDLRDADHFCLDFSLLTCSCDTFLEGPTENVNKCMSKCVQVNFNRELNKKL